jgi:hypothetical protein
MGAAGRHGDPVVRGVKETVAALADWGRATMVCELIGRTIVEYAWVRGSDKPIP